MDGEVIYAILGIVTFGSIAFWVLKSKTPSYINTKENKKAEILQGYTAELCKALKPIKKDKKARIATKTALLKRFSEELSLNIFFDQIEIREIILDLSESC